MTTEGRLSAGSTFPGRPFSLELQTVSAHGRRACLTICLLAFCLTCAGWNKRIEYAPGAGSLALFPGIRLETCDEPLWNIQATIELQTSHVAKGCDRDNYSERALRKLCGACVYPAPRTIPSQPSLIFSVPPLKADSSGHCRYLYFRGSCHVWVAFVAQRAGRW